MAYDFEKKFDTLHDLIKALEINDITFFSICIKEDDHKETLVVGCKKEQNNMWHMTESDFLCGIPDNRKGSYILCKDAVWIKLNNILEMIEFPSIAHTYDLKIGLCF